MVSSPDMKRGCCTEKRANSPFVLHLKADGLEYGKDFSELVFSELVHRIQKRGRNAIPFHL